MNIEKAIKKAWEIIEKSDYYTEGYEEYWYSWSINEWQKNNYHRIYVNLTYGRTYKGARKWTRGTKCCIDLNTMTYKNIGGNYCNAAENDFAESVCESIIENLNVKKYNMSAIMKKAAEYRKMGGDKSTSLKLAWEDAKKF